MRPILLLLAIAMVSLTAGADDAEKVRAIDTKDLKLVPPRGGKASEPAVIASREELARSPVLGRAAEAIARQVDFAKEKVVVFAWTGSGQDRVDPPAAVKDRAATFSYVRGRTRDLRQHVRVFAVPRQASVKVEIGK